MINKIKINKQKRGSTIVEFLLYMGLLSIFLIALSMLFSAILTSQLDSISNTNLDQDGQYILARLQYDIARANEIIIPSADGLTSNELELEINNLPYSIGLAGQKLVATHSGNTIDLNGFSTNVTNFVVDRSGNDESSHAVTVSFTLSSKITEAGGIIEQRDYTTTVGKR